MKRVIFNMVYSVVSIIIALEKYRLCGIWLYKGKEVTTYNTVKYL